MISRQVRLVLVVLILKGLALTATSLAADPVKYDLSQFEIQDGLSARIEDDALRIEWKGARDDTLRLILSVENGQPTLRELAMKPSAGEWRALAQNLVPEYRLVSGLRRVTQQQTEPLEELGIPLTSEKIDEIKWDAFWDAPLYVEAEGASSGTRSSSIPSSTPFANHPGMPRKASEIARATASYRVSSCAVRTKGTRLEILFPGVDAGIFSGALQFEIFKGSNLILITLLASTENPSVAFKYDAGLSGLSVEGGSAVQWRDLESNWKQYRIGVSSQGQAVAVKSANRVIAAELPNGSLAAFPPPHRFFWARESEENLGYSWFREDEEGRFSFGIRQAEQEGVPHFLQNFALYNARPGKVQRMPMFLYASLGSGKDAIGSALAFTRGDRFKALPGHKVMGHHYHVGLLRRLGDWEDKEKRINDVDSARKVGIDIYSIVDGVRGAARHDRGEGYLDELHAYYEAARRHSNKEFLLMPNDENSTGGRPPFLGGHYDLILSKPLYWKPGREENQPLAEPHPKYGTVYNLGTPSDLMAMTELENVLVSMPHPRAKRSTGYPDAIWETDHFQHENYFGLGYRWGMGIDASERRLGEYRFLRLWDETNNRMAQLDAPFKFAHAISEARSDKGTRGKPSTDDIYGMSPVSYLKIERIPSVHDMSSIVKALKSGDFFVTSGEVLIPFFEAEWSEGELHLIAELEWTFPLEFVEVVWGDGERIGRDIIETPELPAFGRKRFRLPIELSGKKWVRFAAWDVAGNGALVQPVDLRRQPISRNGR